MKLLSEKVRKLKKLLFLFCSFNSSLYAVSDHIEVGQDKAPRPMACDVSVWVCREIENAPRSWRVVQVGMGEFHVNEKD
jgi:hypothetical protein